MLYSLLRTFKYVPYVLLSQCLPSLSSRPSKVRSQALKVSLVLISRTLR